LQQRRLGYSHPNTCATLRHLLRILHRHDEAQRADDLLSEFVEGIASEEEPQSVYNLFSLAMTANLPEIIGTPACGKLVESAAEMYVERLSKIEPEAEPLGQDVGVRIASAATENGRPDLAEQVARAAWDAYGGKNAKDSLPVALINSMLANGKVHDAVRFLQYEVPADSEYASGYDYNSDGDITSTEKLWPWDAKNYTQLDKDLDGSITAGETGEAMWGFFADADQNEDHSIDLLERFHAVRSAYFIAKCAKQDTDQDGQLSEEEWLDGSFDGLDANGDGKVSRVEFRDRLAAQHQFGVSEFSNPMTPALISAYGAGGNLDVVIRFVRHGVPADSDLSFHWDYNSDGQITSTEVYGFWGPKRHALLDKNSDGLITPDETGEPTWSFLVDADVDEDNAISHREAILAMYSTMFILMDVNRDGQLSEQDGRGRRLDVFDTDGDGIVSKKEFMDRVLSPRAGSLTPEQKFANNDADSGGQVTADEADVDFWESIKGFDLNGDDVVELSEYEQGLQQRNLSNAEKLWSHMDQDSDGLAGQKDVPSAMWDDWIRFDANGDKLLSKEEFLESQRHREAKDSD